MASTTIPRDYSLIGPEAQKAKDKGLASATWYTTPIPCKRMKELMRRSDQPAIRDTAIWLGLLMLTGGFSLYFWGTWWCVPFFFVYGILYGSASDSRWHECGHGTAFRTQWMNQAVYQLACFMIMRSPLDGVGATLAITQTQSLSVVILKLPLVVLLGCFDYSLISLN